MLFVYYSLLYPSINQLVKFPRALLEEGARFVVDSLRDAGECARSLTRVCDLLDISIPLDACAMLALDRYFILL